MSSRKITSASSVTCHENQFLN